MGENWKHLFFSVVCPHLVHFQKCEHNEEYLAQNIIYVIFVHFGNHKPRFLHYRVIYTQYSANKHEIKIRILEHSITKRSDIWELWRLCDIT